MKDRTIKVCHLTSAHNTNDIRIFVKECTSLSRNSYDVYLVGKGTSKENNNIHIIGIKPYSKRLMRILFFSRKVYKEALRLNCDIYHFHDPELLLYGLKLKKIGKKVIFDSHENVPDQIKDKVWIPKMFRLIVSKVYFIFETYVAKRIDAVVAATPYIEKSFINRCKKVINVNNYPIIDEITCNFETILTRKPNVCYSGLISINRGIDIMEKAVEGINVNLNVAGLIESNVDLRKYHNINYLGVLNRKEVNALYNNSVLGLVLLLPVENYKQSIPTKMFEYMAAGIPFIATNFSFWEEIVKETKAGICVDVNDIEKIKNEIIHVINDREYALKLGKNGRKAVELKYNWKYEENKLLELYANMTCNS